MELQYFWYKYSIYEEIFVIKNMLNIQYTVKPLLSGQFPKSRIESHINHANVVPQPVTREVVFLKFIQGISKPYPAPLLILFPLMITFPMFIGRLRNFVIETLPLILACDQQLPCSSLLHSWSEHETPLLMHHCHIH